MVFQMLFIIIFPVRKMGRIMERPESGALHFRTNHINHKSIINHKSTHVLIFLAIFHLFASTREEFPGMPRRNRSATTLTNAVRLRNWPCPAKLCSSPSKAKLARTKPWNTMEINMARALCRHQSLKDSEFRMVQNGSDMFRYITGLRHL